MKRTRSLPRGRLLAAAVTALALTGTGTAVSLPQAQAASPPPVPTLVVHAGQPFRPVTHVATGSLYGLSDDATPSDDLARAIKPNTFVQMAAGGTQQPKGDILATAAKAERLGAKVVNRIVDYYPGWPYRFSWDNWFTVLEQQVEKTRNLPNLASYEIWNEADQTWLASNGTFEDLWTKSYRKIRALDPTTPIQGPSFSDNISDMENFLRNAVATDTVPDIISWHELIRSSKIKGDIEKVEAIEKSLGIEPRPIAIEEYAAPAEVGIPGSLVGYVAKFERYGVHDAELPFWNGYGALGDLLTGTGGQPNGAYWLYKWYADMSGDMVDTTSPDDTGLFDGAASVTADERQLEVIAGGGSGPTAIKVDGLDELKLGKRVDVKLEVTPTYGRTVAVPRPITISQTTYTIEKDGSISVPLVMNPAYGYHLVVTKATTPTSLAGTYRITNLNSGLALDTADALPTAGTPAIQATSTPSATSQTWSLQDAGRGLYQIVNTATGLALGVKDAVTANGTPVAVWTRGSGRDQLWQLVPDGKGHYRFANYGTGLVLAVDGMSKQSGAPLVEWTDGSVTSGCTPDGPRKPGRIGLALDFCNTASYVSLPTGVVGSLTGDYTVSAWVNPAANATWSRLFDIGSGSSASMFLTLNDGNELRYAITTSGAGGEQRINGTGRLPLNQWSLVTVTVSGTTGTLYVNGQPVGTNPNMTIHPAAFGASTRNYIGKSQYSDPALNAAVDDFNIYDRALSAAEVATLATGQVGAGNVAHYAFDEPSGTAVKDSSGAARDAALVIAASAGATTTATDAATADHFWSLSPWGLPWDASAAYRAGDQVSFNGSAWRALWWTQGQQPGDTSGPWEEIATAPDGTALWTATRVFQAGERAVFDGVLYEAKWWTRNQQPGDPDGPWRVVS